ncbi:MAG: AI-2E family transporter [Chloroflexi bacterium]|nr:AI-2E family transporter [Chloroflexota bacterium]
MPSERVINTLLWLVIIGATLYLIERLAIMTEVLAGPVLIFALAWLIVVIIEPVFGLLDTARLPRLWSVVLVYIILVSGMVVVIVAVIPVMYNQVNTLAQNLPAGIDFVWGYLMVVQGHLERIGIHSDSRAFFRIEGIINQFGSVGTSAVQQSLGFAGSIAQRLFDIVVVLMVSFYMALDGRALFRKLVVLCPHAWRDEVETFGRIMTQTFGGFVRAQIFSSVLYSVVNAVVMLMFDLPSITLATLIIAVALMVPVVGGFIALIPPVLIILTNQPHQLVPYLVVMLVVQQVLFHVILPRIMGRAVGLHPLLVFAALLIGSAVAGAWGVLFGIPLVAVAASVANYVYVRNHPIRDETA